MKKTILMILIISISAILLSACAEKKSERKVTLDHNEITVECGQTFTLNATVEPADSDMSNSMWLINDAYIVNSLDKDNASGKLSANFKAVSTGSTYIGFCPNGFPNGPIGAYCTVTVIEETEEHKAEREKAEAEEKAAREKAAAEAKAAREARAAEEAKTLLKGAVTIKLKNDLPVKLHYNSSKGQPYSSCEVTGVKFDGDTLIVTGKKTSDYRGETGNQPCTFRYKLYDSSNTVVSTQICEVYGLVVGETFKKEIYLYPSSLDSGTYTLQLTDYSF